MGREDLGPALLGLLVRAGVAAEGDWIDGMRRLSGGASRETWSLDLVGPAGTRPLILQRARAGTTGSGPGMAAEAELMRLAATGGVPVPRVLADDGGDALGAPCVVMERLEGETIARKILRDDDYAAARQLLTEQSAAALAGIHAIDPTAAPASLREADQLDEMRALLDGLGRPHPAFELGVRWLDANRPAPTDRTVVHGDFRLGNLLVGPDGLRGVLDWELAHLGDPAEDLGWLCVRAWRFGSPHPVAGVGSREDLLAAYAAAGGRRIEPDVLRWWEVLGTLKWGIICIVQAEAHLSGASRSVELATIGRRVCENEWDVLDLLPGGPLPGPEPADGAPAPGLHGHPTAGELVEAVREWISSDVRDATEGRVAFHARVAANALAIVERELTLGPAQGAAHQARLAGLGASDDEALAAAIRAGELDDRAEEVRDAVARSVRAKLEVANPRWLSGP
jgi:aminoglycoside phosphotransferase (APT) family kinase protein